MKSITIVSIEEINGRITKNKNDLVALYLIDDKKMYGRTMIDSRVCFDRIVVPLEKDEKNGCRIPKRTFQKCLDYIYELTEGNPELNDAVIMTGAFAGVYCQMR